ncbi:MAG: hypothetical protein QM490_02525 [Candidatus Gracilibacteria bacterium]
MELYFFKDNILKTELDEQPNLDNYKSKTIMTNIIATSWEEAKRKLLVKHPNTAYIHMHETRSIDIGH